jgi:hypothetical protein
MRKVALLPILLVITFSSSPLSATTLTLGAPHIGGDGVDAKTCFASCDENFANPGNGMESVQSTDSAAQTTVVLPGAPSISARSEADVLNGGGVGSPSFEAIAKAAVTLVYNFEIVGPQTIQVPVLVQGNGNYAVTGNFASSGNYIGFARLLIDGNSQNVFDQTIEVDGGIPGGPSVITTQSASFSVDKDFDFLANTPYEVFMQIETSAVVNLTDISNLVSTASIDPSFQIDPSVSGYSIVFSDGIGGAAAATPLPATLPLFAGGLGFVGYLARRKRSMRSALAI